MTIKPAPTNTGGFGMSPQTRKDRLNAHTSDVYSKGATSDAPAGILEQQIPRRTDQPERQHQSELPGTARDPSQSVKPQTSVKVASRRASASAWIVMLDLAHRMLPYPQKACGEKHQGLGTTPTRPGSQPRRRP